MLVVFLGKTLKENKGLFLLSLSSQSRKDATQSWVNIPLEWVLTGAKRLFSAGWRLLQLKGWIGIRTGTFTFKTVTQLELKTWFWFTECENSHTLRTTNTGSKNSQKQANNQTDNQNQCSVPPKGPFFTGSWSWMKSSARHRLSNKLS